jgi:predicted amidophosphoribosyltransferase
MTYKRYMFIISNIRDVFKCPGCKTLVAHGDRFCRRCGRGFTVEDVAEMKGSDTKNLWNGAVVAVIFFIAIIFLFIVASKF